MAMAAANLNKKRKPDQESDLLHETPKPAISYIPKHDNSDDDSDEDITGLLEPLNRDQLLSLLRSAALAHPPTLAAVRSVADLDPSHRKIFVHGLDYSTTAESLRVAFSPFGPADDVRIVTDKATGRSKGYGFILFRHRKSARKALKQPQKLIDGRMTGCQLASMGPSSSGNAPTVANPNSADNLARKVYVGNVHQDIDVVRLRAFFAQFGEIEEGPLGLDRATGKPKGFALFVYKTLEGARKALEEPSKNFEGHLLTCNRASDNSNRVAARGPTGPQMPNPGLNPSFNPNPNPNPNAMQNVAAAMGSVGTGYPGSQPVPGAVPGAVPDMNPLLGQSLMQPNALLAMLAAVQQNPAVLASLNQAALAAAFGGGAAQNVASAAPGVQPTAGMTNQGYGGMGSVGYQQSVGGGFQGQQGIQGPPGYQGPPGFQNAAQMGAQQGGAGGAAAAAGSYQGGAMARPPVGQMGGYGQS